MDRFFDNYIMTPMQRIVGVSLRPAEARDSFGVSEARTLLDTAYQWLDDRMSGGQWAAGDSFTLADCAAAPSLRSEEHTSELQSLMRISYAVFCLKKKRETHHLPEI